MSENIIEYGKKKSAAPATFTFTQKYTDSVRKFCLTNVVNTIGSQYGAPFFGSIKVLTKAGFEQSAGVEPGTNHTLYNLVYTVEYAKGKAVVKAQVVNDVDEGLAYITWDGNYEIYELNADGTTGGLIKSGIIKFS